MASLERMSSEAIVLREGVRLLRFTYADMLRYHDGGSPGGVAHAFKVLQRGLPLLEGTEPLQRRELEIETAFGGPGARDGFELATQAVSDGRYRVLEQLSRRELGPERERFVFRLRYRAHATTLTLREGFVTPEFLELAHRADRSAEEELRLTALKEYMAAQVMGAPAERVYDAEAT